MRVVTSVFTFLFGVLAALTAQATDVQTLITGSLQSVPAGVRFSPQGDMYIVDSGYGKIHRLGLDGQVLETFQGPAFQMPSDLDIDASGNIYWNNSMSGNILKRSPDGTYTVLGNVGAITDGVTVCPSGRVFTSGVNANLTWELDPSGVNPPRVAAQFGGLDAFGCDEDDMLYGPNFFFGGGTGIFKINPDTGDVVQVGSGFVGSSSVRVKDGKVLVLDQNQFVYELDLVTGQHIFVADLGQGIDNFDLSPQGTIYFAQLGDAFIGEALPSGLIREVTEPGLAAPSGIVVLPVHPDKMYVGASFSVSLYSPNSGNLFAKYQLASGDPNSPTAAFSMSGDGNNLILTNWMFNLVQVWDPINQVTLSLNPTFALPLNAIRFQGEVIVAQLMTGDVVRESDRTPWISGLYVPSGLVANGGDLYVADWATGVIWKAAANGVKLDPAVPVAMGLVMPEGMAYDPTKNVIYVAETGAHRLSRVNLTTGVVDVVASNLEIGLPAPQGCPPTWATITGVAKDPYNPILFVSGDNANVVYRITDYN